MSGSGGKSGAGARIVVTVQGVDQVGIVARVTTLLAECRANLTDISQSVLGGDLFVMVAVADLLPDGASFENLSDHMAALAESLGVEIRVQREEIFRAMHRV
ncbi:MAG: ACT domain-containing protein [Nitrospirota bacterium]|nr:ACT domain-containing protein [Nitrospirota bacterium]